MDSIESRGAGPYFYDGWRDPGPPPLEHKALPPVWVQLEAINVRVPGMPKHVAPEGLDMSGQVRGLLERWYQSGDGDWLGFVNFSIPYADGRRDKLKLSGQLVPAYALRPREDDSRNLPV